MSPKSSSDFLRYHPMENIENMSNTFVCRPPKHGYRWNQLYLNPFIITTIILVTTLYGNKIVHVESLKITSSGTNCSAYKTCTQCTNSTLQLECTWLVEKQMCYDSVTDLNSTENLVVTNASFCPKFLVNLPIVTISNDQGRFIGLLKKLNVVCQLEGKNFTALVQGESEIVCSGVTSNLASAKNITYLSVIFNDTRLQFDNVLDHYVYPQNVRHCQKDTCLQCPWDDDHYRYYCIVCPISNTCMGNTTYQHCDVRTLTSFAYVHVKDLSIGNECPTVRIKQIQPEYGWRNSNTHVQIVVNSVLLYRSKSSFVVNVAGRRCSSPTSIRTNGTMVCIVSPNNDVKLANSGPVEVTYIGTTNLTIRSNEMFEFGNPVINSVQPTYGPITDNTLLNIYGNFFYASDKVQAFVGDNLECQIKMWNRTRVECLIILPSNLVDAVPLSNHDIKLVFDSSQQIKYSPGFQYVADPTVDAGQTFDGIASGNTILRVHGQRFSYLQNPMIRVHNNHSYCEKRNDTYMECRLPALNDSLSNQSLKLSFLGDFAQKRINITDNYTLYPNPVFDDFTIDQCCNITVKGKNLDHGYRAKDDLSIQLVDKNSSECWIISVESHQITCWISSNSSNLKLQHITIQIGYNIFKVKVAKKRINHYNNSSLTSVILPSVITITMYVAFITCLCVALLFLKTSTKQYDLMSIYLHQQLSEMQPLNEHRKNPVDIDDNDDYDDDKSKNMPRDKIIY